MPDSPLPPWWGPAPFDERDLDAVLSGEMTDIPVALRPVADTLAALQAAPMPAELRGEATIMAEFRALAEFRAAGLGQDGRAGDPAQTLVLSVPPEGLARRRAPRHRARRRTAPVTDWRAGTLISAAAVAAVVLAVLLVGFVPGPIQRLTHLGTPSASTPSAARHAGGNSSSPKVEATSAVREPTAPPTAGGSATPRESQASRLCHTYYDFVKHPVPAAGWKPEISLFRQLSKLAGSPLRVPGYCAPYVGDLFPNGIPGILPHVPGLGNQVGQDSGLAHP